MTWWKVCSITSVFFNFVRVVDNFVYIYTNVATNEWLEHSTLLWLILLFFFGHALLYFMHQTVFIQFWKNVLAFLLQNKEEIPRKERFWSEILVFCFISMKTKVYLKETKSCFYVWPLWMYIQWSHFNKFSNISYII